MIPRPPRDYVPADAIGATFRERVIIGSLTLLIDRPKEPDELLDHPSVRDAFTDDDYLPHWAEIWPAARMLAKAIVAQDWPSGLRCLEIGCGLGVAGIAALAKGLHVTFSDYDVTAVAFAARNARLNGFTEFAESPFDWRDPPCDQQFPLILGSDLTYEQRNHEPLYAVLDRLLTDDGTAWLTDPDRKQTPEFLDLLRARRWRVERKVMHAGAPGQDRSRGTLYRLRRE